MATLKFSNIPNTKNILGATFRATLDGNTRSTELAVRLKKEGKYWRVDFTYWGLPWEAIDKGPTITRKADAIELAKAWARSVHHWGKFDQAFEFIHC